MKEIVEFFFIFFLSVEEIEIKFYVKQEVVSTYYNGRMFFFIKNNKMLNIESYNNDFVVFM